MAALKFDCPRCGAELTDNYDCSGCSGSFKAEIQANTVDETLTSGQTDAQDFMDNVCQELLQQFVPNDDYDSEQIEPIRTALINVLVKHHRQFEYDLYPWLLEPKIQETGQLLEDKQYIVSVSRAGYGNRDITVTAKSVDDAQAIALDVAGDYEFGEHDADYAVIGVTKKQANNG